MVKVISHQLHESGFLRIWHIIGDIEATPAIPALIPVGRTSWLNGVKSGKYPKPIKLGERTTAWRVEDIIALIDRLGENHPVANPANSANPTNSTLAQKPEPKSAWSTAIGGGQ